MQKKSRTRQVDFFQKIQAGLHPSHSLANELVDLLEISPDSAYRRIRGDTPLDLEELARVCGHFRVSFEEFSQSTGDSVTFRYVPMSGKDGDFRNYLLSLRSHLQTITQAGKKRITYACQDLPVFFHYHYPLLARFKIFYWMRSILNAPSLANINFGDFRPDEKLNDLSQEVFQLYRNIPSVEIWTDSTCISSLKQIGFYWESGLFQAQEEALEVCDALKSELSEIQSFAARSSKLESASLEQDLPNYALYFSEIEITNNCVLIQTPENYSVYLGHFSFNTLVTNNQKYGEETSLWLENLKRKSTLISNTSEKLRYQFFRRMELQIENLENKIRKN